MKAKTSTKITKRTSIEEVGAIVSEALSAEGIQAVLTGGAVVSIYSDNKYESFDLDFIILGLGKSVDQAMTSLGFKKEKSRNWEEHTDRSG